MRRSLSLLVAGAAALATGCIIEVEETNKGAGGAGGQGASPSGPCGKVPTTGECVGENKIRSCFVPSEPGEEPKIIEVECQPGEKCGPVGDGMGCVLVGECYEQSSRCKDEGTLQNCVNAKWVDTSCGNQKCLAQPGQGAMCTLGEASSGIKLRGHLDYEYLLPNKKLDDFDPTPHQEGAVDFFVTVYDDGELLGMGLTSFESPGDWDIELKHKPTDKTFYYFWPMLFDDNGVPRMAIAKAKSDDPLEQYSDEYWSWGFGPVCDKPGECDVEDTGEQLIPVKDNAGAANIYQWLDYGIFKLAELIPSVAPLTVAVFWGPPTEFTCGNCFVPPIGGGANVLYDKEKDAKDHYETTLNISGSEESPTHWAKSVITHELGHWVMASYTKSPGEGGPHYVDAPSIPGLAYSEGWATYCGQSLISKGPDDPDPIYFTKKHGTTFWIDLSKYSYSGGPLGKPDPNGPIDQDVNENVIAGMMFSFWASTKAATPQGLGWGALYETLRSQRLLGNLNRGYHTVDFIDYLDAMKCEKKASAEQIKAVTEAADYPYDNQEICP
ncbi:MAG: hypothetical protein HY744_17915 [Deltaproteobacteria bacterium]|nr:hypothetical protein [Deltaproteobacteria bacterium]